MLFLWLLKLQSEAQEDGVSDPSRLASKEDGVSDPSSCGSWQGVRVVAGLNGDGASFVVSNDSSRAENAGVSVNVLSKLKGVFWASV